MKSLLCCGLVLAATTAQALAQSASVTPSSSSYSSAGGQIVFTVNLGYPANVSAVSFSARPPSAQWVYVSTGGGNVPQISPQTEETIDPADSQSAFGWTYETVPVNSATFSFVLSYPLGLTGSHTIIFAGDYRIDGVRTPLTVESVTLTNSALSAAPSFISHPTDQTVSAGTTATFSVAVAGSPAPSVTWQRSTDGGTNWNGLPDGAGISGATTSTLSVATANAMNGHKYRAVASNGVLPNQTSDPATLTLLLTGFGATHGVVGPGYVAGSNVTIATTIAFTGEVSSLGATVTLPTGWKFVSDTSTAQSKPEANDLSVLDWNWTSIPSSPVTFTYTLSVPISASGDQVLTELLTFGVGAGQAQFLAQPDPLTVLQVTFHSSDTNGDMLISGPELNRVIQLFNTRFTTAEGKTRTGAYVVQSGTPDGFAPDSSRESGTAVTLARYHSADTNGNGQIEGAELNRVIQLFNTRYTTPEGKLRTGAYKIQSGTPDGFAPDPDRVPPQ